MIRIAITPAAYANVGVEPARAEDGKVAKGDGAEG
jgi:hypothetical protein